jgi:putative N-acetyltransferase (TIGR04045 family)
VNPPHVLPVPDAPTHAGHDLSTDIICVEALDDEQRAMHHRIRHAVFVEEQAIFAETDVDLHDARADVVRVLALRGGVEPVGAVRLYPVDLRSGLWKGDRLAVLAARRTGRAGAPLVRYAVAHAREHGGRRMIAHIQLANVGFFERLGWSAYRDTEEYLGLIHQPMDIALTHG